MKVAFITATLFSFLFAFVAALPGGQNAQRMARGLAPLPPVRRQPTPAPVVEARSPRPSNTPQCNGGSVKCCNSLLSSTEATKVYGLLLGLLGITIPANTIVGVHCSGVNVIGGGGKSCTQQTVCCNGNTFSGLITLGCTPISLG
ncbi:fungal hydrophobin-domain-containing protein [Coprinopsis sp. MPI-PUGE-AT-0042]|nr:fungal hydrophobin-domain-containing protein [Coprinopsis sp. MPI-PUGE-AT-0042]